jgi:hypothetical protein
MPMIGAEAAGNGDGPPFDKTGALPGGDTTALLFAVGSGLGAAAGINTWLDVALPGAGKVSPKASAACKSDGDKLSIARLKKAARGVSFTAWAGKCAFVIVIYLSVRK